ncbi:MAG: sigma-54-dependent Fis family transcriptional regulator [Bdellovibrionales bacterium]|nr:sigma-54-dependent Fis family transcriptional regulator [Bdellovibrionales bacterium]
MSRTILGESPKVKALLEMIRKVSGAKTNVLVIGESGTGKELVARMIHESGALKGKPFVPVNCGAIPETLIESELFGHKKGSFTGAVGDKIGLFEVADTGTLFLDEVGELPLSMQVKLLRAIQEKTIRKVGGTQDQKIDVRIIAATNRDLEAAVAKGTFREDLYYRLNVILIQTPALRERQGDIRILAEAFLKKFAERSGKTLTRFEPEAMSALEHFSWPGNIRELENIVERAATLETSEQITCDSLPPELVAAVANAVPHKAKNKAPMPGYGIAPSGGSGPISGTIQIPAPDFGQGPIDLDRILGDVEREFLVRALDHTGGVRKKAAEVLGITFRSIRYRLKKLGVTGGDSEGVDASDESE